MTEVGDEVRFDPAGRFGSLLGFQQTPLGRFDFGQQPPIPSHQDSDIGNDGGHDRYQQHKRRNPIPRRRRLIDPQAKRGQNRPRQSDARKKTESRPDEEGVGPLGKAGL